MVGEAVVARAEARAAVAMPAATEVAVQTVLAMVAAAMLGSTMVVATAARDATEIATAVKEAVVMRVTWVAEKTAAAATAEAATAEAAMEAARWRRCVAEVMVVAERVALTVAMAPPAEAGWARQIPGAAAMEAVVVSGASAKPKHSETARRTARKGCAAARLALRGHNGARFLRLF